MKKNKKKHEQREVVKARKVCQLGLSQIHAHVKHSMMREVGQIQETETDDIKARHVKRSVSRMSSSIEARHQAGL